MTVLAAGSLIAIVISMMVAIHPETERVDTPTIDVRESG
jgi:hypothetical protein